MRLVGNNQCDDIPMIEQCVPSRYAIAAEVDAELEAWPIKRALVGPRVLDEVREATEYR